MQNELILAQNSRIQRLPKPNNDDSSSSRESSPESDVAKRSFTPTSDDDDLEIPTIENDDTPPPPDKPVIRQALGFAAFDDSSTFTTSLNTYQAKPTTKSTRKFLPGQSVAPLPKPKKAKVQKPPKKKKKEDYTQQIGRFRLNSNASTSEEPPAAAQPTGARSNMHSLSNHNFGNVFPSMSSATPTPPPQFSNMYSSLPPPSSLSHFSNQYTSSTFNPIPVLQSGPVPGIQSSPAPKSTPVVVSSTGPSKGKAPEKTKSASKSTTSKTAKQKPKKMSSSSRSTTVDSFDDRKQPSYYRRDYDARVDVDAEATSPSSSSEIPRHTVSKHKSEHSSVKQPKSSRPSARMITILITDIRSGVEDHQLAEVIVALKEADAEHPEYGFWANAQEIVDKLQETPSRIDGPARVYTMRGRYRQFFLRVTDDNQSESTPANVSVSAERVLEVVVEASSTPGRLPAPPRIPRDLQPSPDPDDLSSNSQFLEPEYNTRDRKRHRSLSDAGNVDHGSYSPQYISPPDSVSYTNKKKKTVDEVQDSDTELFITPLSSTGQEWSFQYDTPTSSDDEDLDKKIIERIDPALQMHPVEDYGKGYGQQRHSFQGFGRRRVPFKRNRNFRIKKIHILKALRVLDEDDEFSDLADAEKICDNCFETLHLLSLYGPDGTRLQDSRVQGMLEDESTPEKHRKPQKLFLKLLREIDEKWRTEHAEEVPGELVELEENVNVRRLSEEVAGNSVSSSTVVSM
ncbi:hypothetical protein BDP27DRAFT_1449886 [Rhodocollybia butyracea]|uniref:Uncharacterized protein n=1 Tax=Rhodocollybia butyracea TaxID=206335 RepID=A0A9P5U510_9AGAR|nr:hypothetical protein BDP27DRAFT_1449886 [Rhodocollybia butyracea]